MAPYPNFLPLTLFSARSGATLEIWKQSPIIIDLEKCEYLVIIGLFSLFVCDTISVVKLNHLIPV